MIGSRAVKPDGLGRAWAIPSLPTTTLIEQARPTSLSSRPSASRSRFPEELPIPTRKASVSRQSCTTASGRTFPINFRGLGTL